MTRSIATRETFESLRREDERGEWWSARDLQFPLGYDQWRRFEDSIERAMAAATNAGHDANAHFAGAGKLVQNGLPIDRYVADYRLSRFGAYLVAMNGDPRKPEIACAQTYFAAQTRRAELHSATIALPDRRALARMVIEAEDAREAAERERDIEKAKVAELEPAARLGHELVEASGDYSVEHAAKLLCRAGIPTGERKLFATLRQIGWLIDSHTPYQAHINNGRLAVRASRYWHEPTQEFRVSHQVRITAKGLAALHKLLGGRLKLASGA